MQSYEEQQVKIRKIMCEIQDVGFSSYYTNDKHSHAG